MYSVSPLHCRGLRTLVALRKYGGAIMFWINLKSIDYSMIKLFRLIY